MSDIFVRISNGMDSFNKSEKRISQYMLDNWKKIIYMSTQEFAKNCGVSDATIIRFCRKLQLSGFKELKLVLSMEIPNSIEVTKKNNIHEEISVIDSTKEIYEKITYGNIKALNDTSSIIDFEQLEIAINKINTATNIYLLGVGGSSTIAKDLQYKLMRINIPVTFFLEYHLQLVASAFIKPSDVVLAITNLGKTKEVNNILKYSKEKGATTIAITQFGSQALLKYTDILLYTSTTENNMRVGAMASRIAQLNIIDSLFIGIISKRYPEAQKFLKITREMMDLKN